MLCNGTLSVILRSSFSRVSTVTAMVVPKSGRNKTMPAAGCGLHRHQQSLDMVRGGAANVAKHQHVARQSRKIRGPQNGHTTQLNCKLYPFEPCKKQRRQERPQSRTAMACPGRVRPTRLH